jgi:hypothetical protein
MKTEITSHYIESVTGLLNDMCTESDPKSVIATIDLVVANLRMLRKLADMELKQLAFSEGRDL